MGPNRGGGMNEKGSAPLELAMGIGLLVIPALIAVLSFAPWLEARAFVRAAAAEGARTAVLAGGDPTSAGIALVTDLASNRGYDADIEMCGGAACILERDSYVTARVTVDVPLIATPWGDVGGVAVEGFHAEPVDLYRSLP